MPLVLMLHGRGGNGKGAAGAYYGWKPLADKEKFIVAFPSALGSPTSWKGAWMGKPTADSKFLAELIDKLIKELRVDSKRVFMTGHSSGGFMSYSFASTHSEKIAAIGPVAGQLINRKKPKVPVSVISFHGMADHVVPYGKAGVRSGMGSAVDSADFFAKRNKCQKPKRQDINKGNIHIDTWAKGLKKTEVQLYSIVDGDHGWPQKKGASIAATPIIWKFFKNHPK
jgi:polyhydroxybutyrate depolymerase